MAEGLHHQVGREAGQARSPSSSRVIGPVVSPTVVILVRNRCPGGCPVFRHAAGAADHLLGQRALPGRSAAGRRNRVEAAGPGASRALW